MLSGLMGALLSVDNKLEVGQTPTYTLTGAKPNSQVFFELYLNGQPYQYGDTNPRIVGSDGVLQFTDVPWYNADVGQWKRVANIIDLTTGGFDSAEVKFTVSPKYIGPQASPTPSPTPAPIPPVITPPVAPPTTPPATTTPVTPPVVPPRNIGTPREPIDRGGTVVVGQPIPDPRPVIITQPGDILTPYPEPPIINVPEDQIPPSVPAYPSQPTYPTGPVLPSPPIQQPTQPADSGLGIPATIGGISTGLIAIGLLALVLLKK